MTKQWERIIIASIYFTLLTGILWIFIENPFIKIFSAPSDISIIYFTGANQYNRVILHTEILFALLL